MSLFKTMEISASGLTAQSLRMDVIAQNVANAETTRTAEGGPYQRKSVVLAQQEPSFAERLSQLEQGGQSSVSGVAVSSTQADQTPFQQLFDPNHPDADENGFVQMPNVAKSARLNVLSVFSNFLVKGNTSTTLLCFCSYKEIRPLF